jgi:hypothetical protein
MTGFSSCADVMVAAFRGRGPLQTLSGRALGYFPPSFFASLFKRFGFTELEAGSRPNDYVSGVVVFSECFAVRSLG